MSSLSGHLQGDQFPIGVIRIGDVGAITIDADGTLQLGGAFARPDPNMPRLANGDIVAIEPDNQIRVIFRVNDDDNFLFLTNQCQNRCLFCSQPPTAAADYWLAEEALAAIPLMPPSTRSLGITGGEPTLVPNELLAVLTAVRSHLPDTRLDILSNGRRFAYLGLVQAIAEIGLLDLMVAIPIHAETPSRHDEIAGAAGAWGETVRGCLNLARLNIPVELRIVITRSNFDRLEQLAEWISRNMPFAAHVAWMGLEIIGFAADNVDITWIHPTDFSHHLHAALRHLDRCSISTSIYNLPNCHLAPDLWKFATSSISSWKRTYQPGCESCSIRQDCGGFFATGSCLQARPPMMSSSLHQICGSTQSFGGGGPNLEEEVIVIAKP